MPKTEVDDWDTTAGNNTDVGGINIGEGMSPGNVNNAMREMMAQLKTFAGTFPSLSSNQTVSGVWTFTTMPVIPDQGVVSAKLANLSVTEGKIAADAVTNAKIGTGAVTFPKIASAAVATTITASTTTVPRTDAIKAYVDALVISGSSGVLATTSGTAVGVADIPDGVTEIDILFNGVSLNANDDILVQLGDAGGYETSGYVSSAARVSGTSVASFSSAIGFVVPMGADARVARGILTLRLADPATFLWVASWSIGTSTTTTVFGGGSKALSERLDRVQLTRDQFNTFDAGSVTIRWRF